MFSFQFLNQFSRLAIGVTSMVKNPVVSVRGIYTTGLLQFNVTNQLWAEPMRKKKKMDPAIVKAREDRRRKRLEKQIRRLEKNARQLKPIDEVEPPLNLIDQMQKRKRSITVTAEQLEARALLLKEWTRFKRGEYINNVAQVDRIMAAQRRALDKLYEESEELYNEAIMPDLKLIPYSIQGTYSTPPIKNYDSPDGEYHDVSKKWGNN